jgi:(p)ppGpp synthase/HD superfamily hydrolase
VALFSPRVDLALKVAAVGHAGQVRKGTELPYIAHPVHVARLLEQAGLPEPVVIAGILHDVLEDLEPDDAAARARFRAVFPGLAGVPDDAVGFRAGLAAFLVERFGDDTMTLVEAVTEQKEINGRSRAWIDRKREAIAHLQHARTEILALKAADVLHNVQSICQDIDAAGPAIMKRFNASPDQTLWYYRSVADVCGRRLTGPASNLARELDDAVNALAGALADHFSPLTTNRSVSSRE